jgi:hypothetical protein
MFSALVLIFFHEGQYYIFHPNLFGYNGRFILVCCVNECKGSEVCSACYVPFQELLDAVLCESFEYKEQCGLEELETSN